MTSGNQRSLLALDYYDRLTELINQFDEAHKILIEYQIENGDLNGNLDSILGKVYFYKSQLITVFHNLKASYNDFQETGTSKTREELDEILSRLEQILMTANDGIAKINVNIKKYQINSSEPKSSTNPELNSFKGSIILASKFLVYVSKKKNARDFFDRWISQD